LLLDLGVERRIVVRLAVNKLNVKIQARLISPPVGINDALLSVR